MSTWPIRYFQIACVLGGFKTPAILLFTGPFGEDDGVAWHEWLVWIQRLFFLFYNTNAILFYIFCFLFHEQRALVAHLVKALDGKHWDLGSNPRSPQFASIILFNSFPCSFHPNDHHTPNASACHVSQMVHPVATTCHPP